MASVFEILLCRSGMMLHLGVWFVEVLHGFAYDNTPPLLQSYWFRA